MGQYSALVAAGALVARRRRPARPRARPADAGVRPGPRRRDGRAHRPRRCATPRAGRRRLGARRLRRRQPQRPGPGRRLGRAAGHRGGRGARQGRSAPSAPSCCPSPSPPTPRSWPRRPRACGPPSPASSSTIPTVPLLANADARPIETAEACRTELVEHLTAGVDWVRAVEQMAAAGVTTFVEIGPGRVLTGLIRRIAPGCRGHRRRRSGIHRSTPRPGRPCPPEPVPSRRRTSSCASPTTTAASSSPVSGSSAPSATTSRPPGPTSSTASPASARSPSSTRRPYEAKLGGEVHDFDADRLDGRQGRPPERAEHAFRGRRGQAGARRLGLRDHRREPDRGRGRLRLGRRRADADDRQLRVDARSAARGRSPRRSSPTPWSTAARG